jgi:hypothetical protein
MAPRTSRFWCCGSSLGCCAARAALPGSPHATGSCSLPPVGCSPDSGGHRCLSRRRRCALAPHAGSTEVDPRGGAHAGQATDRLRGRRPRAAHGEREFPVGLRADLWGAAQAWHRGGCHDHQDAAATTRPGPGAATLGPTWTRFLKAQAEGVVACDLFTVETIRLKTPQVVFFIHLSTRRVVLAGVTAHPDSAWSPSRPGTPRWCGCRNPSTSCDLGIFVDQPAEAIQPHDRYVGRWSRW